MSTLQYSRLRRGYTSRPHASVRGLITGTPQSEANQQLRFGELRGLGSIPGVLDVMIQEHPRVLAGVMEMEDRAASAPWDLRPCDTSNDGARSTEEPETPRERDCRLAVMAALRTVRTQVHRDGVLVRGTFERVMARSMVDRRIYGFYAAGRRWAQARRAPVGADGQRLVLELFPIRPSSVSRWIPDPEDPAEWVQLEQQTADGQMATLDRANVIHTAFRASPGEHGGLSMLIALLPDLDTVQTARRFYLRRIRLDSGLLKIMEPQNAGRENAGRARQLLEDSESDEGSVKVPYGWDVVATFPTGTATSPEWHRKYTDAEVDQAFGRLMATLGATAEGGAYALGKALDVRDNELWRNALSEHGQAVTEELIPWLADELGYRDVDRLPTIWVPRQMRRDIQIFADNATKLSTIGALDPRAPKFVKHAAQLLELPEPVIEEQIARMTSSSAPAGPAPTDAQATRVNAPAAPGAAQASAQTNAAGDIATKTSLEVLNGAQMQAAVQILSSLRPRDPETVPLAPSSAIQLLISVGMTEEAATRIVKDQLGWSPPNVSQATAAAAQPAPVQKDTSVFRVQAAESAKACGCVTCAEKTAPTEVRDIDGRVVPFPMRRELRGAERYVRWAENESVRQSLEQQLAQALNAIAAEHERLLREAAADGLTPDEKEAIKAQMAQRYLDAETLYLEGLVAAVREQGLDEATRQRPEAVPVTNDYDPTGLLVQWGQQQLQRAREVARIQAQAVASIVQTQVEMSIQSGRPVQRSEGSLAYRMRGVGNRIEATQRIAGDAARRPAGMRPIRAGRTGVRNKQQCDVCASRDGKSWDLSTPEGVAEFIASEESEVPDPDCKGDDNCRCGMIVTYGRVA